MPKPRCATGAITAICDRQHGATDLEIMRTAISVSVCYLQTGDAEGVANMLNCIIGQFEANGRTDLADQLRMACSITAEC